MHKTVEDSVIINQPAEAIFAFLSAPESHAKFIPDMLEFEQTSSGAFAQVGAQARGLRRFSGITMEIPYEVTEVEPNKRLSMKGVMGPVKFNDGYILEARGDATLVRFWLQPTPTGLLRLARPFILFVGRTHAAETLSGLKRAVEGRAELQYADAS